MIYKKGAMFGLDARIALAIFGALSVISGAALYSAIQQSKVISTVAMLNEFAKAYEQYVLDTGEGLPANSGHAYDTSGHQLVDNALNVNNWKGPYLPFETIGLSSLVVNTGSVQYGYFLRAGIEDWDSSTGLPTNATCDGSRICHAWVSFKMQEDQGSKDLMKKIDEYVDNGDGPEVGKVRYTTSALLENSYVRFLIGPSIRKTQG
jgi:type II secretory pathway pseudopilin PulG